MIHLLSKLPVGHQMAFADQMPFAQQIFPFGQQIFPVGQQIFPFGQQIWSLPFGLRHLVSKWDQSPFAQQISHLLSRCSHLVSRFLHLLSRFGQQIVICSANGPICSADFPFGQQFACHLVNRSSICSADFSSCSADFPSCSADFSSCSADLVPAIWSTPLGLHSVSNWEHQISSIPHKPKWSNFLCLWNFRLNGKCRGNI